MLFDDNMFDLMKELVMLKEARGALMKVGDRYGYEYYANSNRSAGHYTWGYPKAMLTSLDNITTRIMEIEDEIESLVKGNEDD